MVTPMATARCWRWREEKGFKVFNGRSRSVSAPI